MLKQKNCENKLCSKCKSPDKEYYKKKGGFRSECKDCTKNANYNRYSKEELKLIDKKKNVKRIKEGYFRKQSKKEVEALSDNYLIHCLKQQLNKTRAEIKKYPELLELKKLEIQLKRKCKLSRNYGRRLSKI